MLDVSILLILHYPHNIIFLTGVRSNHLLNNRYYEGIVGEGTTEDEWFEAPGWTLVEIENEDPMPNR